MIKPRKPDKIKPGTPHPTKAYTVRGFNGKWITTKSYHADRRRREKAAKEAKETKSTSKTTKSTSKTTKSTSKKPATKGGSLTKRVSSALTKTSNKAGELLKVNKGALDKVSNQAGKLLKINKGDKGLIRGIKDTYQMGKDTRKSADALYNAGKITREVYNKLVQGTKDFFGGVKESGKATKRVVNALKPGGKLVAQAKKFNGVNYDLIPKSIRGKLVKVSTDGGKSKTFKFDYSKIPENFEKKTPTRFTAPGVNDPRDPSRPKKKTLGNKLKSKVKGVKSHIKKTTGQTVNAANRLLQNAKLRVQNVPQGNTKQSNALKMNKYLRQNVTRPSSGIKGNIGQVIAGAIADKGLNWALGPLHRRNASRLGVSEEEYLAWLNDPNPWKRLPGWEKRDAANEVANKIKIARQPTVTRNRRGQVTSTQQPVGRNWQNPYMGPPQPKINYKPEKEVPPPQQGTDSTKKNETVDKVKVKNVEESKNYWKAPMINVDKPKKKDKPKNKLKAGFSERQIKSQIRNLKRRNKASDRMKIKRLQALL
jgi:hypothetical protein